MAKKRMNPKIKRQWVQALRSGEIKQGQRQLRNEKDEMCCLGVLCNLHAQAHPEIAARQMYKSEYMDHTSYPPDEVLKWAGLPMFDPVMLLPSGDSRTLSELNDGVHVRRRSFKQIAQLVEEQL